VPTKRRTRCSRDGKSAHKHSPSSCSQSLLNPQLNLTNLEPRGVKEGVNEFCNFAGRNGQERDERKGWRGAVIPPHTECSRYSLKTRNIRGKPRNSRKSGDSWVNPDTPTSQRQHPRKVSCEHAGAKVSLIGFVKAARALVRLLEDTFLVPLYSKALLGLKFKNVK
jgi:hypothetical protein